MKKRTKDLLMLLTFLGIAGTTYIFHIIQAQNTLRTYFTAITLLISYYCTKINDLPKITTAWEIYFAWVIQSAIYYHPHTHFHGYLRLLKHVLCIAIALISATGYIVKSPAFELAAWTIFALIPDVSSNIYGNAMFSILRLFIMTVILLLDKEQTHKKELIWIFTAHESILSVALLQIALKVLPITLQQQWPFIQWKKTEPTDVITKEQVPFLLARGGLDRLGIAL